MICLGDYGKDLSDVQLARSIRSQIIDQKYSVIVDLRGVRTVTREFIQELYRGLFGKSPLAYVSHITGCTNFDTSVGRMIVQEIRRQHA